MSNFSTTVNVITNHNVTGQPEDDIDGKDDAWKTAKHYTELSKLIEFILFNFNHLGVLLNILCFVIFIRMRMYRTAVGLHLTVLSIADGLVTLGACFVTFWFLGRAMIPGYIYPIDSLGFTCRGMLYIRDTGWHLSSFITLSGECLR